ncbi:MAG: DinB family protein [Acidobacteria bacterium]|nr:DinB family protein [Acidobacteriota bacterium]
MKSKISHPLTHADKVALALAQKIAEQIDLTQSLLAHIPADKLEWQPLPQTFCLGDLLGHLLEAAAGFCAALYALHPEGLHHFVKLRQQPVNHRCHSAEAAERLSQYQQHIAEGFALLMDEDLARPMPTLFVPQGETAMTVLLGNLEHFINHKYQLFFYLKLLGVGISTPELYRFRQPPDLP